MVAGLGGREGEAATGAASLRYYAVVVVEQLLLIWLVCFSSLLSFSFSFSCYTQKDGSHAPRSRLQGNVWGAPRGQTYVYGDEDADPVMFPPCMPLVVVLLCSVVSNHQCVLRELFIETFLGRAVEVEIEGLSDLSQGAQGHEREECPHACCCFPSVRNDSRPIGKG